MAPPRGDEVDARLKAIPTFTPEFPNTWTGSKQLSVRIDKLKITGSHWQVEKYTSETMH